MSNWLNPTHLGGEFHFTAGPETVWDDDAADGVTFYVAELPHQCDAWTISKDRDPDVAIAAMKRFIREAQAALAVLITRAEEAS